MLSVLYTVRVYMSGSRLWMTVSQQEVEVVEGTQCSTEDGFGPVEPCQKTADKEIRHFSPSQHWTPTSVKSNHSQIHCWHPLHGA